MGGGLFLSGCRPSPPRRHLLALAHPLTGLLTPPSSWLILTLPGLQSRCPPTTPPTPIQREDLMPEARIAGGWGQAGRRSLVILGQRSGSWMGTSQGEGNYLASWLTGQRGG